MAPTYVVPGLLSFFPIKMTELICLYCEPVLDIVVLMPVLGFPHRFKVFKDVEFP